MATSQNAAAAQMQSCSSTVQRLQYSSCASNEDDAATEHLAAARLMRRCTCRPLAKIKLRRIEAGHHKGQQILLTGQTNFAEGLQTELELGAKNCKGRALAHLGNFDRMTYEVTTNRT